MRPVELQQAVYDGLNVAGVTALLSSSSTASPPIYTSGSPQQADAEAANRFPYITFAIVADEGFTDKDTPGSEAIAQVDVWHRTASELTIRAVGKAVFDAMHRVAMAGLTGHITTECTNMEFSIDDDGITRRCLCEFRILSLG